MGILEIGRPHGSKAEKRFSSSWLDPIRGMTTDGFGNRILKIEGVGDSIIWASHVDTVHHAGGKQSIRKKGDVITLADKSKSRCLGADDGAGVWLMLEMIAAGKPGTYIFHRAEEVGGLGSDFIASNLPELTAGVDAVVSLDRFGFDSVITNQGGRTSSDGFAVSLAQGLKMDNLQPDDGGLFTDSANYVDVVGECTNLSVGYFGHHTKSESLDVAFICLLRSRLLELDTSALVFERMAGDPQWDRSEDNAQGFYPANYDSWVENVESQFHDMTAGDKVELSRQDTTEFYKTGDYEHEALTRLLSEYPEIVADIIRDYGITLEEVREDISFKTGITPAL
jgi:hypothetical protein